MRHELAALAALIDWDFFEREWAGFFPSAVGRPATSPRLVAGLLYLQHSLPAVRRGRRRTLGGEPLLGVAGLKLRKRTKIEHL